MEQSYKATEMGLASCFIPIVESMKATGRTVSNMARVMKNFIMGLITVAHTQAENQKDTEHILGITDKPMKENG